MNISGSFIRLIAFSLFFLPGILIVSNAAESPNASLAVGYADIDITPPLGGSMPGYFTERLSTGILDPLLAKVLVLTEGKTTLAIVALDLIGLEAPEVNLLREAVTQRTGIPKDHIFVHCTHTHTGAETPDRFTSDADKIIPGFGVGKVNQEWVAALPGKVAEAVEKAIKAKTPQTQVTLGTAQENTVAFIRRYVMKDGTIRTNPGRNNPDVVRPNGTIDPVVTVLSFESAKTLLINYGLHLDCIGGTQYSADYPYHITQTVKESLGSDWNVLYLNGCNGNINHINVNDADQKSGYEESRRIGRTLAQAALAARKTAKPFLIDRLDARTEIVQCPIRKVPPDVQKQAEQDVEAKIDMSKRNFNELHASGAYILSRTQDKTHPAEIIAFRIGSLGLVGLPAEVFVEIKREIQKDSPLKPTLVINLTGGAMGYMPHPKGYEEGGYEAGYISARYDPVTPTRWIQSSVNLLKELVKTTKR